MEQHQKELYALYIGILIITSTSVWMLQDQSKIAFVSGAYLAILISFTSLIVTKKNKKESYERFDKIQKQLDRIESKLTYQINNLN